MLSAAEKQALVELYKRALSDPEFHRKLEKRPGSAKPLKPDQVFIIREIEGLMADGSGDTITVMLPRQYGKNEIAATVHERHLIRNVAIGGSIVRAAPTYKPQTVNSRRRLEKIARNDPLFDMKEFGWREGYIGEYGNAEVQFLSSDVHANIEGATASCLLDIDEAHLTSVESYEEKLAPMTASTNAPKVMWGVAAHKRDLLYKTRMRNMEMGKNNRNIRIPAMRVAEQDEIYRQHYEGRVRELGADHPVILTQYDLVDVDHVGGAFKPQHVHSLFDSDHVRANDPEHHRAPHCDIIAVIDMAGEEESDSGVDPDADDRDSPDAVVMCIASVDRRRIETGRPLIRILDWKRWVGRKIQPIPGTSELSVQELIINTLHLWQPKVTLIDSRGVGNTPAAWLSRVWPRTLIRYAANISTVSEDLYATYAYLNLGQLKMFRDDRSEEYAQLTREMSWVRARYSAGDKVNIDKPSPKQKIDMVKALTYLTRAAGSCEAAGVYGFHERL